MRFESPVTARRGRSSYAIGVAAVAILFHCADAARAGFDSNALFALDSAGGLVVELNDSGAVAATFGSGAGLSSPSDLAFGPDGNLYVASTGTDAVLVLDSDDTVLGSIGAGSGLTQPTGLAFAADGRLYVTSGDQGRVFEFDAAGTFVRVFGQTLGLSAPRGLAVGPGGHLFIASHGDDRVVEITQDGTHVRDLGAGLVDGPDKLAFSVGGALYVTATEGDAVVALDRVGAVTNSIDGLVDPRGCTFGPDGRLRCGGAAGTVIIIEDDAIVGELTGVASGDVTAVAHAPVRLAASVVGDVHREDGSTEIDEPAELTLFPGAGRMMLRWDASGALARELGGDRSVFIGFEDFEGDKAKERILHGVEYRPVSYLTGAGSLSLAVVGASKSSGFKPKSVTGTWSRSSAGVVASFKVKAKKSLP